ncbi:HNH endonuclease signature motif containing protein [Xenorhabdus bovienii]|uniref:HNH endonuclease signature motif containing protein n=1 Tax=Xenorhabdus bovienii TaxID=40576 RepID=UPI003DA3C47C
MANWTEKHIKAVWEKAEVVKHVDSNKCRKDQCGAWIQFDEHGNRDNDFGWEIDHITPVSKGGSNLLANLRPLQWENNASRSDDRLKAVITSDGNKNVRVG